jgi:serine/threonine protein kinase
VLAEMLTSKALFPGETSISQFYEIMKVLGNPTQSDILAMNSNVVEFDIPTVKQKSWDLIFPKDTSKEALNLIRKMLKYNPTARITALDALMHPFFDDLRLKHIKFPLKQVEDEQIQPPMPDLFNFTPEEKERIEPELLQKLIPKWYEIPTTCEDKS